MGPKDQNVLLKLVKRSVGLPTGKGGCCGPVAVPVVEDSAAPAAESQGGECGCAKSEAEEEESTKHEGHEGQ